MCLKDKLFLTLSPSFTPLHFVERENTGAEVFEDTSTLMFNPFSEGGKQG
jgi:hypothetical protein